jgi:hypothetical protein
MALFALFWDFMIGEKWRISAVYGILLGMLHVEHRGCFL